MSDASVFPADPQKDLSLERVDLVYPGELSFPLRDGMEALGYARIADFQLPG